MINRQGGELYRLPGRGKRVYEVPDMGPKFSTFKELEGGHHDYSIMSEDEGFRE